MKCLVLSKWQILLRVDSKQCFPLTTPLKVLIPPCLLQYSQLAYYPAIRGNASTSHLVEDVDCRTSHNHNQHSANQVGGEQNALADDKGSGFQKLLYYTQEQRIRFRNTGSEARNVSCSSDMIMWTTQKTTHHT